MGDYQTRIEKRRLSEARRSWELMQEAGFREKMPAALDFTFFSDDRDAAQELGKALSDNYRVEIKPASEAGYWLVEGTTRPYANDIGRQDLLAWVEYMLALGFAHHSMFSVWSVYAPALRKTWSSEDIEAD